MLTCPYSYYSSLRQADNTTEQLQRVFELREGKKGKMFRYMAPWLSKTPQEFDKTSQKKKKKKKKFALHGNRASEISKRGLFFLGCRAGGSHPALLPVCPKLCAVWQLSQAGHWAHRLHFWFNRGYS